MSRAKNVSNPRKQPLQERSRLTVNTILQASTQILNQIGLEDLSTNKIAQKAGISIGSLYQYFPNKESIIAALLEQYVEKQFFIIREEMGKQKGKDLESTIRSIVHAYLAGKKSTTKFNKFFAQMLFKIDGIKQIQLIDDRVADFLKQHVMVYKNELRDGNIDWMVFNMINIMKVVPVSVMFDSKLKLDDPDFEEELCLLLIGYLKR
jgi:AcrR family transcriptional regulator